MSKNNEWKLIPHSYQIADTGDYDGHWELTNGAITLTTTDDHLGDEEGDVLVKALNDVDCKWINVNEDAAEFEKRLLQQQVDVWKEVAGRLYEVVVDKWMKPIEEVADDIARVREIYLETVNNQP
jgi:hypothetical protein